MEQFTIADAYFDDLKDALDEARERRASHRGEGMITRVDESPYGGYRVHSIPADFIVDLMADGVLPPWQRPNRIEM